MPLQATPSLRFSMQFISLAAQSGSSAKPIATVLFPSSSSPFWTIPSPFLNKSALFKTFPPHVRSKLFRNSSCQLYVFPTQSIAFQNCSYATLRYSHRFFAKATLFSSMTGLRYSFAHRCLTVPMLFSSLRFLRHSRHFLSLPLPHIAKLILRTQNKSSKSVLL